MRILRERRQIVALSRDWRRRERATVALVPTMGNLHEGHLTLVRHALTRAERVVVSIFINPLQFDRAEDLAAYPRTLERDSQQLAALGVDALFCPEVAEMYPEPPAPTARVLVPGISEGLEGAARPGHFVGVATVVAKLFNLIQPDVAVFGEKDFQQLRLIEAMVTALDFPVLIEPVATVRDADGLALSSRNSRLSPAGRERAPALQAALRRVAASVSDRVSGTSSGGLARLDAALVSARADLDAAGFVVDYLCVRRASDLAPPEPGDTDLVLLAAASLDGVRLLDNLRLAGGAAALDPGFSNGSQCRS
jgi:pantoate--beta-alanine ligase